MAKKLSEQERIKQNLINELKDLYKQTQTKPTIYYKVSDKVDAGNFYKSTVVEVLNYGQIYKIHHIVKTEKYGKVTITEFNRYVAWHDIFPITNNKEVLQVQEDLFIQFSQRDIHGLLNTFYHFGIDTNPDYQRGNVWTLEDKQKLIDSIYENIDIGKFVLIRRPYGVDSPLYEILDGKQRLLTIVDFYEGRFEWRGKTIRDLSTRDQNHFIDYRIAWGDVSSVGGSDMVTDEQKYKYFLKLNTGGQPVDPSHIAKVESLLSRVKK